MSPRPRPTSVPSSILIHSVVWPQRTWAKNWGCCAPLGELGPRLTQCGLGQGLPPCQVSSWSIQPFVHNTPTLQTDRGQTGRTGQDRQRSDRLGRTVLQTVKKKQFCQPMHMDDENLINLSTKVNSQEVTELLRGTSQWEKVNKKQRNRSY